MSSDATQHINPLGSWHWTNQGILFSGWYWKKYPPLQKTGIYSKPKFLWHVVGVVTTGQELAEFIYSQVPLHKRWGVDKATWSTAPYLQHIHCLQGTEHALQVFQHYHHANPYLAGCSYCTHMIPFFEAIDGVLLCVNVPNKSVWLLLCFYTC